MTDPYAALATTTVVLLVLVVWGAGEAVFVPIVPDVLIGILAMTAPWELPRLLVAAIAGGLVGGLAAWWLLRWRRPVMERALAVQPGLGAVGLTEAAARVRANGPWRAFAQLGPGLPLKAYLHGLAVEAPATSGATVGALVLVNRVVRLVPVTVGFALLHPLAVRVEAHPAVLGAIYTAGWAAFYIAYWRRRDPGRRR